MFCGNVALSRLFHFLTTSARQDQAFSQLNYLTHQYLCFFDTIHTALWYSILQKLQPSSVVLEGLRKVAVLLIVALQIPFMK